MIQHREELHREGQLVPEKDRAVWQSWTALFGPVGLYVVYFTLAYLVGEAGCKIDAFRTTLLGSPLVTTVTVLLGVVVATGVILLARLARRISALDDEAHQFMGRAGLMMSGLSLVMIVATVIFVLAVTPC